VISVHCFCAGAAGLAVEEDRAGQAVAGFAAVELAGGAAPQLGVLDPVEGEQRPLQPAELAQRGGDAVLARVGGELSASLPSS
jgi:hypothetical protein